MISKIFALGDTLGLYVYAQMLQIMHPMEIFWKTLKKRLDFFSVIHFENFYKIENCKHFDIFYNIFV